MVPSNLELRKWKEPVQLDLMAILLVTQPRNCVPLQGWRCVNDATLNPATTFENKFGLAGLAS